MQEQCFEVSRTTNADVQRKLKNKYDTRAAAAVENITKQGTHTHTYSNSDTVTLKHAHRHTHILMLMNTHTYTNADMHTQKPTCIHTHARTIHTHTVYSLFYFFEVNSNIIP